MRIFNSDEKFQPCPIDDYPMTPLEYESFCNSYNCEWKYNSSVMKIEGYHYTYFYNHLQQKIRYELGQDGLYHIVEEYAVPNYHCGLNEILSTEGFDLSLRHIGMNPKRNYPAIKYAPKQSGNSQVRFALEQKGERTLIVIGLNPSTANNKEGDPTMKKVLGFARKNGFDGFVMLNLYPFRATNPNDLPLEIDEELHQKNLKVIAKYAKLATSNKALVLAAFGDNVLKRTYLSRCLSDIVHIFNYAKWCCIGEPTKQGNPRHPLYEEYSYFKKFDIIQYKQDLTLQLNKHLLQYCRFYKGNDDKPDYKDFYQNYCWYAERFFVLNEEKENENNWI